MCHESCVLRAQPHTVFRVGRALLFVSLPDRAVRVAARTGVRTARYGSCQTAHVGEWHRCLQPMTRLHEASFVASVLPITQGARHGARSDQCASCRALYAELAA